MCERVAASRENGDLCPIEAKDSQKAPTFVGLTPDRKGAPLRANKIKQFLRQKSFFRHKIDGYWKRFLSGK
jgi:hypothetical protein